MQQPILYEFPLNERMRNFMRLENHFSQINYLTHHNSIWDSQVSILALIEVLNILDRNDIRGELIKELERNTATLSNLLNVPGVDIQRLQLILDQLNTQLHAMHAGSAKDSRALREDDLLNSIRQRVAVAATINSFDVPGFYNWLHQSSESKRAHIAQWLRELRPLEEGISLLNNLLRDSADFETETATAGFFQRTLNPQHACQMVRIQLSAADNFFPETSGSKHRINIRFLGYDNPAQRPVQIAGDVTFKISCCSI